MFFVTLIAAILLGLIPANIADKKGKNFATWWLFGAALFIVALPMALLAEPEPAALAQQRRKEGLVKCPFCAEYIKKEAKVCRYCGRDIPESNRSKPSSSRGLAKPKEHIRVQAPKQIRISMPAHSSRTSTSPTPPPASSHETAMANAVSVPCPHCQVPIDITGLSAGTYECPNCHGNIELE